MPKFFIEKTIYCEYVIEADSLRQAIRMAECNEVSEDCLLSKNMNTTGDEFFATNEEVTA